MKDIIENLLIKINETINNPRPDCTLPQNTYYLNNTEILCCERETGVSRFLYCNDGLVLSANSNGLIEAHESTFDIFKKKLFCEDPSVSFFGGLRENDGTYTPIALFDTQRQLKENVKRYVVFSSKCAYYIADTDTVIFALRVHTDKNKHIHFSFNAVNKTNEKIAIYMFSMIESKLKNSAEDFWDRMRKFGNRYGNSYILRKLEDCLTVNRTVVGGEVTAEYHTVAKGDVIGSRKTVLNADCLINGKFKNEHTAINTVDIPAACDMINAELKAGEAMRLEFDLSYHFTLAEAEAAVSDKINTDAIDEQLNKETQAENSEFDNLKISFGDWNGNVNAGLLNKFLRTVQKQVSTCALGKSYVGNLLGMRDVMQQLEGALMYQPEKSREKIVRAFNYILEDGRPPRQFSIPVNDSDLPTLDLKKYIDQGLWIISTVYTYIAFTNDYTILDEICTYYIPDAANFTAEAKSEITDSVLDHLIKIMGFLSRNIDTEYGTNCLRILRGDWNDPLNGLGFTDDADKEYGSGVSVMATLQFYQNCKEMVEILSRINKYTDKIQEYNTYRNNIETGLFKYAVDTDENGNRRIVHGWGDKIRYKLGSFCDPDGISRTSSTSHSFWAISGMIKKDESLKATIKEAFEKLRSKYGFLTFDKPFLSDMKKYAGNVAGITPGSYENACSYVHAAMFGIMGLFAIGESEFAWKELEHSITISHSNCTMSPFVMPNSYCDNPEYGMDGQSMGDWYTGSGTVLLKEIVRYGFGVNPDLDGVHIALANTMPCSCAELSLTVKGKRIKLIYKNNNSGTRTYKINGVAQKSDFDTVLSTSKIYIPNARISDLMEIEVLD